MKISLLSALMIRTNETTIDTYCDKGTYGFIIYAMQGGKIHCEILKTEAYYKNKKKAITEGENLVKQIKEIDLIPLKV